ncbi:MAG: multicopper oxidase family protein [Gemmatimonadaceae bacterium]
MRSQHSHHASTNHSAPSEVIVNLEAREAPWTIAPGKTVTGWTYNGHVPGPTIEVRVGDTVVVRLTNTLPESTTIHWHGLRIPAPMDGTEMSQNAVAPGESFEYRFTVPDAGTFWYHAHTNETVQMERGLYGALIVRSEDEPMMDGEQVLVLDDVSLSRRGDFAKFTGVMQRHNGRVGDVHLVNGREQPELTIAAGQVERWRIVNAASARYVLLAFGGRPFKMLGTTGGLLEAPVTTTAVLLVPGARVDIAIGPFEEGEKIPVESLPYDRHAGGGKFASFATIQVSAARTSTANIPERLRVIAPLAPSDAPPTRQVRLGEKLSFRHGMDFLINGEDYHNDTPVTVGELQLWEVLNTSHMDHPFHLHGFFFQVLSANGTPPEFRSWEDTINLPPKSRLLIAWMPDDRPGNWMYHCHILEHHAAGMMANFAVVRPGDAAAHASLGHCHT